MNKEMEKEEEQKYDFDPRLDYPLKDYLRARGFTDTEEIYTNGCFLVAADDVMQWYHYHKSLGEIK